MKIAKILVAMIFPSVACADPAPVSMVKWLKIYQIKSIILQKGILSVTIDRPKVTREIYGTVVVDGVCMSLIDSPASWGKVNLEQIEVINSFGTKVIYLKVERQSTRLLQNRMATRFTAISYQKEQE